MDGPVEHGVGQGRRTLQGRGWTVEIGLMGGLQPQDREMAGAASSGLMAPQPQSGESARCDQDRSEKRTHYGATCVAGLHFTQSAPVQLWPRRYNEKPGLFSKSLTF